LGKAVMAVPGYFQKFLDMLDTEVTILEDSTTATNAKILSLRELKKVLNDIAAVPPPPPQDQTNEALVLVESAEIQAAKTAMIFAELEKRWTMEEKYAKKIAALVKKQADAETKSAKYSQQQKYEFYAAAAGQIAGTFLQISQAGGKQSKEAFKLYQAFSIAQAGMSAAAAVVKTLAEPALPYPGNVVMAAIIAGMAAVQISLIASATPPSYDLGGISTQPGLYYAGVREAHIPLPSGSKIPVNLGGGGKEVSINMINPVFQDLETQRRVMAQMIEIGVEKMAPGAIVKNYNDGLEVRDMVRGGR